MQTNIFVSEKQKKVLRSLLSLDFECGGPLHLTGNEIDCVEIYVGEQNFVEFPQWTECRKHHLTFHTHPPHSSHNDSLLSPPSPSDTIVYTLANAYLYPEIRRTALVVTKEGCYITRVTAQYKPHNVSLLDYLQDSYDLVIALWMRYERLIYTDRNVAQNIFSIVEKCWGVHIHLVPWEELKEIPLYTSPPSLSPSDIGKEKREKGEELDRSQIIAHKDKWAHLSEEEFLSLLNDNCLISHLIQEGSLK